MLVNVDDGYTVAMLEATKPFMFKVPQAQGLAGLFERPKSRIGNAEIRFTKSQSAVIDDRLSFNTWLQHWVGITVLCPAISVKESTENLKDLS